MHTMNTVSSSEDEDIQEALACGMIKPGLIIEEHKKNYINNKAGLKDKIKEFTLDKVQWIERMDVTNESVSLVAFTDDEKNTHLENDDFNRELKFYRQSQSSVLEALAVLNKLSVPTKRPDDFFAEMAKSDEHMKKVRAKLLEKKTSLERSEKAKKLREMRKYGKKVQQEILFKKQKEKKEMLDSVKKFRKGQIDKINLDDETIERQSEKKEHTKKKQQFKPNKRREFKNNKFGFGGQKKRSKYNTADSSADLKEFNAKKAHGKSPGQKNAKGMRPGKSKRKLYKNKNK